VSVVIDDVLQIRLGNFVQELGYVSYVDHGPQLALIFGLVFGFALPVIVIVLLLVIFCVRRKRRTAAKHRRPIVTMSSRGSRTDRVHNSYHNRAVPQMTELRPLQHAPAVDVNGGDDEPVKGTGFLMLLFNHRYVSFGCKID